MPMLISGGCAGIVTPDLIDIISGGTYARANVGSVPLTPSWSWPSIGILSANQRRFWDPGYGTGSMLLIEKPSQQLNILTDDFTGWTKTNAAVDGNVVLAPDGTVTADRLRAVAGAAECRIARNEGSSVQPFQLFQVWLKADTVFTASLELVAAGSTTATVDIDLPGDGSWKIYSVTILDTVAQPNVRIRPHKSGALPAAGDAIFVFGGNNYQNSQHTTPQIGTYTPGANPATSRASEQLDYTFGQYDPRILTEPSWHYWVPFFRWVASWGDSGGPSNRYGGDCSFTSFGGAADECLWANSDTGTNGAAGAIRVRAQNGASNTRCLTTPMSFEIGQLMVVQRRPDLGRVFCLGALEGGSSVEVNPGGSVVQFNQPWVWPSSTLRVGGRADEGTGGQHGLDGLISSIYRGVYLGPLRIAS